MHILSNEGSKKIIFGLVFICLSVFVAYGVTQYLNLTLLVMACFIGLVLLTVCIKNTQLLFHFWLISLPITKVLSVNISGKNLSLIDTLTFLLGGILIFKFLASRSTGIDFPDNHLVKKVTISLFVFCILGYFLSFRGFYYFKDIVSIPSWTNDINSILTRSIITNTRILIPLLTVMIIYLMVRNKSQLFNVLKLYLTTAFLASAYGLYEFSIKMIGLSDRFLLPNHSSNILFYGDKIRISGPFGEPSYFAGFLVVSIMFCLFSKQHKIASKFAINCLIIMQSVCLALTYSTVGWFSFIVAMTCYLIFQKKVRHVFTLLFFCSIIFLAVAFSPTFSDMLNKPFERSTDELSSSNNRLHTSMAAFNMFKDNVFLGVGNGMYALVYDKYRTEFVQKDDFEPIANNVYLDVLSAFGLMGSVVFAFIFITLLKGLRYIRKLDVENKHFPFFAATMISILVLYMAYPTYNFAYHWFFFGLLLIVPNILKSHEAKN